MESGWRGVAMAKRPSGDLSDATFCCPRRNFKRPRKFKALEMIRKCGCESNRVMGTGCAPTPGEHAGGRGVSWRRAALPEIPRSYPASSGSGRRSSSPRRRAPRGGGAGDWTRCCIQPAAAGQREGLGNQRENEVFQAAHLELTALQM